MTARFIIGDTRDVTSTLPDGSVDLVLTSGTDLVLTSADAEEAPDSRPLASESRLRRAGRMLALDGIEGQGRLRQVPGADADWPAPRSGACLVIRTLQGRSARRLGRDALLRYARLRESSTLERRLLVGQQRGQDGEGPTGEGVGKAARSIAADPLQTWSPPLGRQSADGKRLPPMPCLPGATRTRRLSQGPRASWGRCSSGLRRAAVAA